MGAQPDPLAEAGNVVWYVRPPSGGQYGPATADIMRNWISEGRISPDTLVWREGWRDWQEAGEVFPQLGAGQTQAAPSALVGAAAGTSIAASHRPVRRRSSKTTQIAMLTGLILVVLVLLVVFLVILFGPGGASSESSAAGAIGFWCLVWLDAGDRQEDSPAGQSTDG